MELKSRDFHETNSCNTRMSVIEFVTKLGIMHKSLTI